MNQTPPIPAPVLTAFDRFSPDHRKVLLDLRDLILDTASTDPRVGPLEEALRWGDPAYLTPETKAGSTIRLGIEKASGMPALFFNCNTTLVEDFRTQFATSLSFSKNRAVCVDPKGNTDPAILRMCILSALTYHLRRK